MIKKLKKQIEKGGIDDGSGGGGGVEKIVII